MQIGLECLFISEIFDNICSKIDTERDSPSLVALARTCQSFRDIALDYLWSDISDIAPLVKCMPHDLWDGALDQLEEFLRPIEDSDWIRFREYSQRVKSITVEESPQCSVDVYRLLGEGTGDQPLLPNVKKVVWLPHDYAYLLYLHVVMGPKVIDLALPIDHTGMEFSEDERFDVIKNLASTYPLLKHVDLTYSHNTLQEMEMISNVICSWTLLQTLDVNSLSLAALVHIAGLPYLQRLSFADVDTNTPLDKFPQPRTPLPFPALRYLNIVARRLSLCSSLIETMRSCALKQLRIEVYGHQLTAAWRRVFVALQNHCEVSSLTSVHLREYYFSPDQEHPVEYTATIDTIQPLLAFPNLTSICVPFSQTIITDSAAEAIAMAWPRLKDLVLLPSPPTRHQQPCLTLQGLLPFAHYCPELESMTLTLGAASIPSGNPKFKGVGRGVLLHLDASGSPIESPHEVATFLSTLCFTVNLIYTFATNSASASSWSLVESLHKKSHSENSF